MSGSTIGGVVGGVVGFWFGNPQLGWMIGSAIGGYVDPEQISQSGPRLTDASQQTARDGVPIPYGYGTFPCHGNLIWCSDITEHVNESTDDGKGSGQEVTTTTYTYTRSYAIGICQGEIAGLLQIKRNGKVVWDTRTDEEFEFIYNPDGGSDLFDLVRQYIAQARAFTSRFSTKLSIYTGSNTQTADPTMEAYLGVGNVTGYRGLAYIVVTDDDVTELRGAVPQYEFVVAKSGTSTETCFGEEGLRAHWPLDDAVEGGVLNDVVGTADGTYIGEVGGGGALSLDGTGSMEVTVSGQCGYVENAEHLGVAGSPWTLSAWFRLDDETIIDGSHRVIAVGYSDELTGRYAWGLSLTGTNKKQLAGGYNGSATSTEIIAVDPDQIVEGAVYFVAVTCDPANGVLSLYKNGRKVAEVVPAGSPDTVDFVVFGGRSTALPLAGAVGNVKLYNFALSADQIYARYLSRAVYTPIPGADGWYVDRQGNVVGDGCAGTIERTSPLLSDIVAAEFQRVGLTADDYDVSQLTDEVMGYRVLPGGSGVDASLGPLMQAYFFDIAEWDGKLRCIKRGGSPSLSLTMDDLAERDGEAIEWTRAQEAELLRVVTVGYIDPAAGYTATTQKWERRAGTVQARGEAAAEIPITALADTAATIAARRGLIAWAEPEKAKLSLAYRHAAVTPTDIVALTDSDGEVHRLRVGQIDDDSGVRLLEVTKERGNVYTATADGVRPGTPTPEAGGMAGPSVLVAMNLPRLRTQDDKPGAYFAVTGLLPGWMGADIYISADGGASEQFALRIMARATMGEIVSGIDADDEPITVSLYDRRTLSSITAAQMAARQNGFAITTDGTSEVGQFQTATENTDGDWELTDTVRGLLGTVATSHGTGDAFVLLDQAVFFHPLDISLAGKTLILRAVSIGTSPDDNETIPFTFLPQFTGPEVIEYMLEQSGNQMLEETGGYMQEE